MPMALENNDLEIPFGNKSGKHVSTLVRNRLSYMLDGHDHQELLR